MTRLANFEDGAVVYVDDLRMFEKPNALNAEYR